MASLQWQDAEHKVGTLKESSASGAPSTMLGFLIGILSGAAVSLLLIGIVVGYAMGSNGGGLGTFAAGKQVAQNPTPVPPTPQPPQPAGKGPAPVDAKTDRIRGDLSKATVAVIEYSDFECPFCKRHFPTMQQVVSTYSDKVAFVYRDFPLSFHQNAHKEAEAGWCVQDLGGNDAFWKYHDYVFEKTTGNGTGFALDQLPVAAKQAGVNVTKFQSCLDSGKYVKAVDDQQAEGVTAGVQGTPGNFVVDLKTQKSTLISGAVPFSSFQAAIDPLVK